MGDGSGGQEAEMEMLQMLLSWGFPFAQCRGLCSHLGFGLAFSPGGVSGQTLGCLQG